MSFGWWERELSPDKVDTVITWFKPIKDVNNENINVNNAVVKKNMKSLYDSASQQVKDWTVVYNECMAVIERFSNTLDKNRFIVKCKYLSGKDESAWNDMKKNDFVLLFADTMKQILEEDKKKKEDETADNIKKRDERLKAALEKATPTPHRQTYYCEQHPDDPECEDGYAKRAQGLSGGGSKKKSRKRTTRNRRSSHRNRRHRRASTHKYKK
jgi:hypothetical protein